MASKRLLIVSNRLPITVSKREGRLSYSPSVGGLATGLASFHRSQNSLWVGWPGLTSEKARGLEPEIAARLATEDCYPLYLTDRGVESFYHGFCNRTIWPLFHYFTQYATYSKTQWNSYKRVNETFADAVCEVVRPGDTIWVHDYHLMLLPRLLRQRLPKVEIGFFLHIPFPSFEVFRLLPWRTEILEGLTSADLVGFHTYDYVRHFLETARRLLGLEHALGQITRDGRVTKVDAFPMGIDFRQYSDSVENPAVVREVSRIRKRVGDRTIILSIDRLDYTKGIPGRLESFSTFLEHNPGYRGKVTLVLVAVPSRTKVEQYARLKRHVDELVGRINGRYGTIGWMPIWYLYRSLSFHSLMALYSAAQVAMVTPLRDGMNLIAKEFLASKTDNRGVLVLSEMAGVARELGEAVTVNPNDLEGMAQAIKQALEMPETEQMDRNTRMRKRLETYDVSRWSQDFVDGLAAVRQTQRNLDARRLPDESRRQLMADYRRAAKRLIFLDYDGTLVPFAESPGQARPDAALLKLLRSLSADKNSELVLISGRDRHTMTDWFGRLGTALAAEHGAWMRRRGGEWESAEAINDDWKKEIRPILELFVTRTPASSIDEKAFSLAWHYRKADLEMAKVRARELSEVLVSMTSNLRLEVLEGDKVIEVKTAGMNKGRAALSWLARGKWDFIFAVGDDWTDEDLFDALPDSAYTFKVGLKPSRARFNIDSVQATRALLRQMAAGRKKE